MSKVKQWAWDCAEKAVDDIIKNLKSGVIDKVKAKAEILMLIYVLFMNTMLTKLLTFN